MSINNEAPRSVSQKGNFQTMYDVAVMEKATPTEVTAAVAARLAALAMIPTDHPNTANTASARVCSNSLRPSTRG